MARIYLFLFASCVLLFGKSASNNTSEVLTINCIRNEDCGSEAICVDFKCEDPCLGVCGNNTVCHFVLQSPLCVCKPGYIGHPFEGCRPGEGVVECSTNEDCPEEKGCRNGKCVDACAEACGPNSVCKAVRHRPICSCSPGYVWSPFQGCRVQKVKECIHNSDCPSNRTCSDEECVDPCEGACGENTLCNAKNHLAACACKPNYVGDPFHKCETQGTHNMGDQKPSSIRLQKKYIVMEEKVSWHKAMELCRSMDLNLASIASPLEQAEIERVITESGVSGYTWVSGSDWSSSGQYVWASTGHQFTYTNWMSGEPEVSDSYRCVDLKDGSHEWRTGVCNGELSYVCVSGYTWVSGSDWSSSGQYVWASTGHRFTYTNWMSGEPEVSDSYRCVDLKDGSHEWRTGVCNGELSYVCVSGYTWVSGSDWSSSGQYVWASTGHRFTYTNWMSGEPEVSDSYRCVDLKDGSHEWRTGVCNGELSYVCEYLQPST